MSSPPAENSRRRIEDNSSAMRFGVVHLGSRNIEFEGCPAARCASSLASTETISLAVAAASAGQRKGVKGTKAHRRCNRHRQTLGLPGPIVNAADRRCFPPFRKPAPVPDARRWALCTAHNIAAELTGTSLYWHIADGRRGRAGPFGWPVLSSSPARYMMMPDLALMRSPPLCNRFAFLMMGAILLSQSIETP